MKIKKLAALGVAAAMAAMPVAFAAEHFDKLPTDRNWYLQSKIVVGKDAIASDVVAASEIAAAIATIAYKKAEIKGGDVKDATVVLEAPGHIVVGGQGYTDDEYVDLKVGNNDYDATYGNTKIPTLASSEDFSFKYYDGSQWQDGDGKYTENIHVTGDVQEGVPDGAKNAEVRFVASKDGVYYTYTISGVYNDELTNKDYQLKNFYVDLLGKKFEITDIDFNATTPTMTLVSSQKTETVPVGSSVDYEGYKIVVGDIDPDQGTAYLKLEDMNGNVVATDIVKAGDYTDFDGTLKDSIKVDAVFSGTSQKFAKLELTADKLTLSKDSAKDCPNADGWKIEWTTSGNDIVIKVYYDGDNDNDYISFDNGLKPGDQWIFPGEKGYGIAFAGFESKPSKALTIDGSKITLVGKDGATHTAILYYRVPKTAVTDDKDNNILTFTVSSLVDDKDFKFKVAYDANTASSTYGEIKELNVYEGDDTTPTVTYTPATPSASAPVDLNANYGVDFKIEDFNALKSDYVAKIFLADNGVTSTSTTSDVPYAVSYSSGVWTVSDINGQTIKIPFDSADFKLNFKDYDVNVANPSQQLDSDDTTDNPANWWLNDGTYVEIESSSSLKITVPTETEKVGLFVGIPAKVEQGGEVDVKVGQTIPGTDYTVKDIKGVASVSGTYYEKLNFDPIGMAVLDSEATSSDNLIVVGGWNANAIAKKIKDAYPEIEQELQKDKKIVNEYTVDGQEMILVAGWEAKDTREAAEDFAKWLMNYFGGEQAQ